MRNCRDSRPYSPIGGRHDVHDRHAPGRNARPRRRGVSPAVPTGGFVAARPPDPPDRTVQLPGGGAMGAAWAVGGLLSRSDCSSGQCSRCARATPQYPRASQPMQSCRMAPIAFPAIRSTWRCWRSSWVSGVWTDSVWFFVLAGVSAILLWWGGDLAGKSGIWNENSAPTTSSTKPEYDAGSSDEGGPDRPSRRPPSRGRSCGGGGLLQLIFNCSAERLLILAREIEKPDTQPLVRA